MMPAYFYLYNQVAKLAKFSDTHQTFHLEILYSGAPAIQAPVPVISSGSLGVAPFCVQTKAEVFTARAWASRVDFPLRRAAMKAAVNESPAPTVSATSTIGVGWKEVLSRVKT